MTSCRVLLSFQIALLWMSICGAESLYNVLGVKRTASSREIQEAYKKLANDSYVNTVEIPKLRISRYPDPNEDPNAIEKFVKLREAYATLGDPKKRLQYDRSRCTSTSGRQPSQSNATIPWFLHPLKIFERFFANDLAFREKTLYVSFYEKANIIEKYSISRRKYETIILPNSNRRPCVIFAFTDCCWGCNTIEEYLQELESFGFCAATFNIEESGDLRSYFGIDTVPALIAVIAGKVRYFNGSVTALTLRDFIRTLFSPSTFSEVTDRSYQGFLDGFEDNRVRAIFFGPKQNPPIHFMACAFYYQDKVAFAYVYTEDPNATALMKKYNVKNYRETLLLFNEETNIPVDISTQQFSRTRLDEILETNKYLMLPRLSSQNYFDELCPPENKVNKRALCVILVTKKKKEHDEYRDSFRKYSQRSQLNGHERVRFSYIYEDTQKDLVLALTKERMQENDTAPLKVAILWREEEKRLSYEWLETGWDLKREKEKICEEALENRLNVLLTTDSILPYQTNLPELCNEHGASLLVRIGQSLLCWVDDVWLYLTSYKFVMCMELFLSLIIYFLMGYILWKAYEILGYILWKACKIMGYILWNPYEILKVQLRSRPPSRSSNKRCYFMHELKRSTYKRLVQEADPGLTIVILVDKKSKYKLLRLFSEITKPYSRDRTLTFGFIKLESHIHWFCELLREGGDSSMMLSDINLCNEISKSVGTVLALNGFGKYYCIYKDTRDTLLHGLKIWLDKIRDGSVNKFGITNWPAMTDTKQS